MGSQNMARGYAGGKNEQRLVGAFSGRKRISKHIDEDQEIKSDADDAAGEVLSGGDEEVGMEVPAPAVADGDENLVPASYSGIMESAALRERGVVAAGGEGHRGRDGHEEHAVRGGGQLLGTRVGEQG